MYFLPMSQLLLRAIILLGSEAATRSRPVARDNLRRCCEECEINYLTPLAGSISVGNGELRHAPASAARSPTYAMGMAASMGGSPWLVVNEGAARRAAVCRAVPNDEAMGGRDRQRRPRSPSRPEQLYVIWKKEMFRLNAEFHRPVHRADRGRPRLRLLVHRAEAWTTASSNDIITRAADITQSADGTAETQPPGATSCCSIEHSSFGVEELTCTTSCSRKRTALLVSRPTMCRERHHGAAAGASRWHPTAT